MLGVYKLVYWFLHLFLIPHFYVNVIVYIFKMPSRKKKHILESQQKVFFNHYGLKKEHTFIITNQSIQNSFCHIVCRSLTDYL